MAELLGCAVAEPKRGAVMKEEVPAGQPENVSAACETMHISQSGEV